MLGLVVSKESGSRLRSGDCGLRKIRRKRDRGAPKLAKRASMSVAVLIK